MKKFMFLGLVLVLLAFAAIPVFAASSNGHGNGGNTSQNGSGNGNQNRGQGVGHDKNQSNKPNGQGNHGQGNRMRTPFYLQGEIKSITGMTVTVTVTHANAQAKQFIGTDITITVTDTTKIFKINQTAEEGEGTTTAAPAMSSTDDETPGNRVPITFADLKAGDIVAIHGNVVGGVYQATLITVYVRAPESGETTMGAGPFGLGAGKFGQKHGFSFKIGNVDVDLP